MQGLFHIAPRLSPLCGARAFIGGECDKHQIIDMTRLVGTGTPYGIPCWRSPRDST